MQYRLASNILNATVRKLTVECAGKQRRGASAPSIDAKTLSAIDR
jgi:hypothetical protein